MANSPDGADSGLPIVPLVEPNTGIPRTIGILNIVFGVLLLLCGVCSGLNVVTQSAFGPMIAAQQKQVQQALEAERQAKLKKLQEQEEAAEDEEQKAAIRAQHKLVQAQPVPVVPDTSKFMTAPGLQSYMIADALSGIMLNVLMMISGIGLLAFKEWARVVALWVAAVKILRLAALYGYFALAVAPVMAQQFRAMFEEMAKAAPPGQKAISPEELATISTSMGVMMTGSAIGIMVLGFIYPAVVLILLTRSSVKAAFAVRSTGLDEPAQPGP